MGDPTEVHFTPETQRRPSIRNPFESPNDYQHLREPLVPSPSVFKSKTSKATPPKFNWSIEEMANLNPVHIDQEEIQRQSFYLSQSRMDSVIEQKRQSAINHFFTKGAIVPSPWAAPETRKMSPLNNKNTVSPVIAENPERPSVGCQTTLSLPLAFDLEKMLGEYYCYEEPCDTVQESLSSSSLRRKLFLDGQSGGSETSTPPSPVRGLSEQHRLQADGATMGIQMPKREAVSSIFSSPLSCGISAPTPSTGQFSSSPIQNGCFRDCSLGSLNSPVFPDRSSPARLASPTISPIFAHASCTPIASKNNPPKSLTPLNVPLDVDVASCNESPFVEGCSPIRSCSPNQFHCQELKNYSRAKLRTRVGRWASPILCPELQDSLELEDQLETLPSMDLGTLSPQVQTACLKDTAAVKNNLDPLKTEEAGGNDTEVKLDDDEPEGPAARLTSSGMGNVSTGESSPMFVSLLTEGSSIRYESNMQVDSGYNTTLAGTGSLIDGLSSDCYGKESFMNMSEDAFQLARHTKAKVYNPHY